MRDSVISIVPLFLGIWIVHVRIKPEVLTPLVSLPGLCLPLCPVAFGQWLISVENVPPTGKVAEIQKLQQEFDHMFAVDGQTL